MSQILGRLPVFDGQTNVIFTRASSMEQPKRLLLSNSKYDLAVYLGNDNLK